MDRVIKNPGLWNSEWRYGAQQDFLNPLPSMTLIAVGRPCFEVLKSFAELCGLPWWLCRGITYLARLWFFLFWYHLSDGWIFWPTHRPWQDKETTTATPEPGDCSEPVELVFHGNNLCSHNKLCWRLWLNYYLACSQGFNFGLQLSEKNNDIMNFDSLHAPTTIAQSFIP